MFYLSLPTPMSWRFIFSILFLALTFRSLVHFELLFIYKVMWSNDPTSFYCVWPSSFPSAIPCKGHSSFWQPCWKSVDHRPLDLYLDSPLYYINLDVCHYASATLSWSLLVVLNCEIGVNPTFFFFKIEDFGYSGCLSGPYEFYNQLVNFYKESGLLIELNWMYICLGIFLLLIGFPGGSDGKESACNNANSFDLWNGVFF